jgi:hypothetical protein
LNAHAILPWLATPPSRKEKTPFSRKSLQTDLSAAGNYKKCGGSLQTRKIVGF